ncbi:hypothetical protein TWF694_003476 [Orbilia ellipsospora]|uniref:Small ribosomal subunit protein mS38 n=1 Tax=Orbilia ellipsospora TaxID=2528407 RepID=A0AAV9WZG8_9PEZI
MFACPTRRALFSCASYAHSTSRRLASTATASSLRLQPQKPTRRYSSSSSSSNSKPLGPNNRGIAFRKQNQQCENEQPAQTSALAIPPVAEVEATSADKPVMAEEPQKSEEQKSSALPFVPRTDHLRPKDLHASTFFALHRPVSVRFPVPGVYTNAAFQKLFDEPTPLSILELQKIQQEVQARLPIPSQADSAAINQDGILNPEEIRTLGRKGSASSVLETAANSQTVELFKIFVSQPSGDYTPFKAPPPPEPITEEPVKPEIKEYSIVAQYPSGESQSYVMKFIEIDPANRRGGRLQYSMRDKRLTMYALSVKRQRKLKMKKHKYKKLMKRTRTLRRKLEKQ